MLRLLLSYIQRTRVTGVNRDIFEAIQITKTIFIEVCLLLNKYDEKKSLLHCYNISIFFKETSESNTTFSNNSVNIGHETKRW